MLRGQECGAHQTDVWGCRDHSTQRKLDVGPSLALSLPQLVAAPSHPSLWHSLSHAGLSQVLSQLGTCYKTHFQPCSPVCTAWSELSHLHTAIGGHGAEACCCSQGLPQCAHQLCALTPQTSSHVPCNYTFYYYFFSPQARNEVLASTIVHLKTPQQNSPLRDPNRNDGQQGQPLCKYTQKCIKQPGKGTERHIYIKYIQPPTPLLGLYTLLKGHRLEVQYNSLPSASA